MAVSPLPLLSWIEQRFGLTSVAGYQPNALGLVYFYIAGTSTPKDTYTGNSSGDPAHQNPIELDADGRPPDPIYGLGSYTVDVRDANDVSLYTIPYVADIGSLFLTNYGAYQAAGTKGITSSPYVVLATDRTITIDSTTNPFIVTLPDVTTWTTPLYVIVESDSVTGGNVRLTPQSGQTVQNGIQGTTYFTLSPATTLAKWAQLLPDSANDNWLVFSNQV